MMIYQILCVVYPFTISLAYQASFIIQFNSAQTTFEILANLAHLPFETLEELNSHIDDPSNGIMLEVNMHTMHLAPLAGA